MTFAFSRKTFFFISRDGVSQMYDPEDAFSRKIADLVDGKAKKKVIIKFGVDPTRPDIHLGHTVALRKLRHFQDLGCKVVFVIGDFTASIGDPTGKSKTRPVIGRDEIKKNMQTYIDQASKILNTDPGVFESVNNSSWHDSPNGMVCLLETLSRITHGHLIQRDMFQERLSNGGELFMHEMLYPVLQGIDSAMIARQFGSCDLEIGGTDQTFNMLLGRDVMKIFGQEEQAVMSLDLLVGTDGKEKMSKSLGNHIGITDSPNDMYGKVMSTPDHVIPSILTLCCDSFFSPGDFFKDHPKEGKMRVAKTIVEIYHGKEKAQEAEDNFVKVFSHRSVPDDAQKVEAKKEEFVAFEFLKDCFGGEKSNTEIRSLFRQGAISLNGEKLSEDEKIKIKDGDIIKAGKMKWFRITN